SAMPRLRILVAIFCFWGSPQKIGISDPLARYARVSPSRRGRMPGKMSSFILPLAEGESRPPGASPIPKHQEKAAGGQFGDFSCKAVSGEIGCRTERPQV